MKIGICIPTRGLVFSETIQAIEKERKNYEQSSRGYDTKIYISTNLPIPNGHNTLCEKALADRCDYILFIEEDVVIPTGAFEKLLASDSDIACIDYGVSGWSCITRDKNGEIRWCGLGCTLIKRTVFEALERPFFRADMVLDLPDLIWRQLPKNYIETRNYGSLDIWFFTKARENGFKITQVEGECKHLQLKELGKRESNYGIHDIVEKPKVSQHQII